MEIKVGTVEVDSAGMRNLFKSGEVKAALQEKCEARAQAMESQANALAHSKHTSLFIAKTKMLDNAAIGLVVSKGGTGQAGRGSNAKKIDLAQTLNSKYNFIHW